MCFGKSVPKKNNSFCKSIPKNCEFYNIFKKFKQTFKKFWEDNEREVKFYFRLTVGIVLDLYHRLDKELQGEDKDLAEKFITNSGKRKSCKLKQNLRNICGYDGIGRFGGNNGLNICKLRSKCAEYVSNGEITDDHVFGVTLIGDRTSKRIRQKMNIGLNDEQIIDYMQNVWLEKNIWLWISIGITKNENKRLNKAGKNKHTLGEKLNLKHYEDANISEIIIKK